jgi:DNA/RNA-binding domain of Phe-tRNA-synthetase-like protein
VSEEAPIEPGPVAASLSAEFPELQVLSCEVAAPAGRSTDAGSRERLAELASRMRGGRAVELRRQPVPAAYRVFFRHIGIDPDVTRTPVEAAALARLVEGGYRSRGPLADALLLALLDTSVPVNAFAAAAVTGPPGLRPAEPGERLGDGERARPLRAGQIVLADDAGPLAELFGELAPRADPDRRAGRLRLVAVRIPGVPSIHVEEALWTCQESLAAGLAE